MLIKVVYCLLRAACSALSLSLFFFLKFFFKFFQFFLLCREGVSNMELTASKLILSRPFSSDSGVLLTGLYKFPSFVYRTSLFSMSVVWCVVYW